MKLVTTIFLALFLAGAGFYANGQAKEDSPVLASRYDLSKSVKLFPNPAIEFLHVTFDDPIAKESKLAVHNIIGNVLEVESEIIDEHEIRLRVKDLPVGYYLLAVRNEESNSRSTFKFLKR